MVCSESADGHVTWSEYTIYSMISLNCHGPGMPKQHAPYYQEPPRNWYKSAKMKNKNGSPEKANVEEQQHQPLLKAGINQSLDKYEEISSKGV